MHTVRVKGIAHVPRVVAFISLQGDGAAIAEATLSYLVRRPRPLTLFITQ